MTAPDISALGRRASLITPPSGRRLCADSAPAPRAVATNRPKRTRIVLKPVTRILNNIASLAAFLLSANLALAQTVSVENEAGEFGFGWMFAHRGSCYVILPAHVAGDSFFLTLRSAAPVASGSATVIRLFGRGSISRSRSRAAGSNRGASRRWTDSTRPPPLAGQHVHNSK